MKKTDIKEKDIMITEKTKNILIDCLESLLDDYEIDETYNSGGCGDTPYSTYILNIDTYTENPSEIMGKLYRILKLCKGDISEIRDENIDILTQTI